MNCEELIHYLSDYIDNDLEETLRADAEEHLRTCQNCHIALDTTQKTILIYKEIGAQLIPASQRVDLFERLQQALSSRKDYPTEKPNPG